MPSNHRRFDRAAFQPRLIVPEPAPTTDEGELALPDDLAVLAEQLGDDAAYLAVRYPAEAAVEVPQVAAAASARPAEGRRTWLLAVSTLTTGLAVSLAIGLLSLTNINESSPLAQQSPRTAPEIHPAPAVENVASENHEVATAEFAAPPDSIDPTLALLEGASGPEREALLDLWKQTATRESGISF